MNKLYAINRRKNRFKTLDSELLEKAKEINIASRKLQKMRKEKEMQT